MYVYMILIGKQTHNLSFGIGQLTNNFTFTFKANALISDENLAVKKQLISTHFSYYSWSYHQ